MGQSNTPKNWSYRYLQSAPLAWVTLNQHKSRQWVSHWPSLLSSDRPCPSLLSSDRPCSSLPSLARPCPHVPCHNTTAQISELAAIAKYDAHADTAPITEHGYTNEGQQIFHWAALMKPRQISMELQNKNKLPIPLWASS